MRRSPRRRRPPRAARSPPDAHVPSGATTRCAADGRPGGGSRGSQCGRPQPLAPRRPRSTRSGCRPAARSRATSGLGGPGVGDAVGEPLVPAQPFDPADQLGGRGLGIGLGRTAAGAGDSPPAAPDRAPRRCARPCAAAGRGRRRRCQVLDRGHQGKAVAATAARLAVRRPLVTTPASHLGVNAPDALTKAGLVPTPDPRYAAPLGAG